MMKFFISVFILIALSCNSCKPFVEIYDLILITNESSKPIRILMADEFSTNQYPDTSLPISKPSLQKIDTAKSGYFYSKTPWKEILKKLPADTLSIYFIDNEIFEEKSWEEIRDNYLILKRLDLSISDLERLNKWIYYP